MKSFFESHRDDNDGFYQRLFRLIFVVVDLYMVADLLDLYDSMAELLYVLRLIYDLSMHLCLSCLMLWAEFVVYQCLCSSVCFMLWLSYGLSMHL